MIQFLQVLSQSLERFLAGFHGESPPLRSLLARLCRNPSKGSSPVSTGGVSVNWSLLKWVAIPRKVPRRFPLSGRSGGEGWRQRSQSLERFLAGFHTASRLFFSRQKKMSQSLERFLAGFHPTAEHGLRFARKVAIPRKVPRRFPRSVGISGMRPGRAVAIPRKVPRRFPPLVCAPAWAQQKVSQSLERFLAGFHLRSRRRVRGRWLRNVAIPRKVPRRFPLGHFHVLGGTTLHVAIPRKVPRRFPRGNLGKMCPELPSVAIPRKVPRRFPQRRPLSVRQERHLVAIPRKVPRRFPLQPGRSPGSRRAECRNPSKGSSPVSTPRAGRR